MKTKFKFFGLFFVLALLSVVSMSQPKAYALACKTGQSLNSDECWTWVRVSAKETNVVSAGAVLIYDITTDSALRDAFEVRVSQSTTSGDSHLVAGVAQRVIATGDDDMILVRGKGKLGIMGIVSTGDRLYVSSAKGKAGSQYPSAATAQFQVSSGDPIAFALQNQTTAAESTIDAYITVR